MSPLPRFTGLEAAGAPDAAFVDAIAAAALAEDLGSREPSPEADLTTAWTVAPRARARARIVARQRGVIAGLPVACAVFRRLDGSVQFGRLAAEGGIAEAGETVAEISGSARSLLVGERTALNLLQRLSGTATLTRGFVTAISGTGVRVTDTRKTTPGLRQLEKYAVRCGGGVNHRSGLNNAAAERLAREGAAKAGAEGAASPRVMAEARDLDEVRELTALERGMRPDRILLDNMPPEAIREAVALIRPHDPPIEIEATGGIGLHNVRDIALTGVDLVSIGALTHSAPALDLSLLFERA
ncbi:MAG: carboxylating nicotinate-nucleotide diphosphorylase [Gemmatimonadetes bacterium]|nr:carboxylating nicotinate-nucleotide diphosphorylase [Gemmatimonadota bacterium]